MLNICNYKILFTAILTLFAIIFLQYLTKDLSQFNFQYKNNSNKHTYRLTIIDRQ